MPGHILAVGEALVDVVHAPDGTVTEHPGGSVANVAVALARLGQPVQLATWIADDARGERIKSWLAASGVRLRPGSTTAHRTPTATATLDSDGTATYEFDLTWRLPPDTAVGGDTRALHTGSIAAIVEPAVRALVESSHAFTTISYDPNVRPAVMGARDEVRPAVEAFVELADVVKVSDEDLAWLAPGEPPQAVAQRWLTKGPAVVVLTRGAAGASAWCAAGEHHQPPTSEPIEVVDAVGAGDAFTGALLWSLASSDLLHRERLQQIDRTELAHHVATATRASELTVQRAGADPPTLPELAFTATASRRARSTRSLPPA